MAPQFPEIAGRALQAHFSWIAPRSHQAVYASNMPALMSPSCGSLNCMCFSGDFHTRFPEFPDLPDLFPQFPEIAETGGPDIRKLRNCPCYAGTNKKERSIPAESFYRPCYSGSSGDLKTIASRTSPDFGAFAPRCFRKFRRFRQGQPVTVSGSSRVDRLEMTVIVIHVESGTEYGACISKKYTGAEPPRKRSADQTKNTASGDVLWQRPLRVNRYLVVVSGSLASSLNVQSE
jgi:hypothetical protein